MRPLPLPYKELTFSRPHRWAGVGFRITGDVSPTHAEQWQESVSLATTAATNFGYLFPTDANSTLTGKQFADVIEMHHSTEEPRTAVVVSFLRTGDVRPALKQLRS